MSLSVGTRLGPYEIVSQLGAGGMGEVYRARDTRLDRTVAIKILPQHLSDNTELRKRFEREARAASALNHPHICTLHDIGHQDGVDYLVLELVEGETLSDRLKKGALPTDQALRYSIQIADALDKAHRAGIIHRDLKPGNIILTKSGAKLLDFGLAKLRGNNSEVAPSLTSFPTERVSITVQGTILGTFQYMAPEQLEGRESDARTDIFAFGAVVYEMATGKHAFTGKSQASIITAIMSSDPPPISSIEPMSPPALDRIVRRCLAKDPDERWQSAHDLMEELKWVGEAGSQPGVAAPAIARRKARERAWVIATVVFFLAAVTLAVAYFRRAPSETPAVTRFFIYPPERTYFGGPFAVSPDGRRVVLRGTSEGKTLLWVRALDSLTAQPLAGTEDAVYPFWSPDSRFIGFFSGGKLKKVEIAGGPAQTLCDASDGRGGTWNRDGVIVFTPNFADVLYRVSAAGGAPVPLTAFDASQKETSHLHPQFLPDGRHFLYLARSAQSPGNPGIVVGSLDSKETKRLVNTNAQAAYAQGYLLFMQERTLMAQGFDADRLELKGEPFPVTQQVDRLPGVTFGLFSVSQTGVLIYRSGTGANNQLAWFDRGGKQLGTVGPPGAYSSPWLSPDERRVAVAVTQSSPTPADIWLIELAVGTPTRFTFDPGYDNNPTWSPDGSRIVFGASRDSSRNLYQKVASGAGKEEPLLKSENGKDPTDWSTDGRFILYQEQNPKTNFDLWVLPLSGEQQPFPFLQTDFVEVQGQFSPNGRWIAYTSNESGTWQVYVQSFPASGGKWQVSTSGGGHPKWRRNGKELFYISSDRKLMAVDVKSDGPTFEASVPTALFELRVPGLPGPRNYYVVAADGQRFLVTSSLEEATATPTTVVLNWTADLKR